MPEFVNPMAVAGQTYDFLQRGAEDGARRRAGRALGAGDYGAASNALFGVGLLDEGSQVTNFALRQRQEADRASKAQQAEHLQLLLASAQGLRKLPQDQRRPAYDAVVAPRLDQIGIGASPEGRSMLAHFGQAQFSDQELDAFIATMGGELDKPEWQVVNLGNGAGVIAVDQRDPTRRQVIEPPNRQARVIEAQDGLWQEQADGSWKRVGVFGPRATAPKGRAGGGVKRGGQSQVQSGPAPWERDY